MKSWIRSTQCGLYIMAAFLLCTQLTAKVNTQSLEQQITKIFSAIDDNGNIPKEQILKVVQAGEQLLPEDLFTAKTMALIEEELTIYLKKAFQNEFCELGKMTIEIKKYKNRYKNFMATRLPQLFNRVKMLSHDLLLKGKMPITPNKPVSTETKALLKNLEIPQVKKHLKRILGLYLNHMPKSVFDHMDQTINNLDQLIDYVVINECTAQDKQAIEELSKLKIFKKLTQTHYEEIFMRLFHKIAPSYYEVIKGCIAQGKAMIKKYFASA